MISAGTGSACDRPTTARSARRRLRGTPGEHEGRQRRELRIRFIDGLFERGDPVRVQGHAIPDFFLYTVRIGRGQRPADGEQVALHRGEQVVGEVFGFQRPCQPDRGAGFVDVSIGGNAGVVLGHPPSAHEPRVATVAGSGINPHEAQARA